MQHKNMERKLRARALREISVTEIAQVGVRTRTRARAEAMAAAASSRLAKRRKLECDEVKNFASYIQLRNRTTNTGKKTVSENRCSSPGLELFDHDRVSTSCCSSHGSSERIEFVDLKVKLDLLNSVCHLYVYLNSCIWRFWWRI